MKIFGREPVAIVGIIVAFAIAIIQTALGQGVISDAIAGQAVEATNALAQVATIFVPILVGIFAARQAVTPTASPSLTQGTTVEVITPEGEPNTQTTL